MTPEWTTQDGRRIPIGEMTDRHLLAALAMLRRKGFIGKRTLLVYLSANPDRIGDGAADCFLREQAEVFERPVSPHLDLLAEEARRRGLES